MSNDRLTTSSGVTGPAGPVAPEPSAISARTSAPPGPPAVFGRAEPLRAARAALAVTGSVVLSGPAGIGKSTLLDLLAVESVEDGARVLRTAPAETEAGLPYLALVDLFGGVVDEVAGLPAHLRAALDGALLRSAAPATPRDELTVRLAVLELLRTLAGARPVLIVVDDVQWVDPPSAGVLAFAARRLAGADGDGGNARAAAVRMLVAERVPEGEAPGHFDMCVPPVEEVPLGPLPIAAVDEVLRTRLGAAFPRAALRRVHQASGGNPFYALELARALGRAGGPPSPTEPLPVPARLRGLLSDRLSVLGPAARTVLLAAAAAPRPTRAQLARAVAALPPTPTDPTAVPARALDFTTAPAPATDPTNPPALAINATDSAGCVTDDGDQGCLVRSGDDALDEAVSAAIVAIGDDGAVRFTHPLLRELVYADAQPADRRATHAALAATVGDPVERARHLALAATRPDPALAHTLAEAAEVARHRGAPAVAADLARLAADRTPAEAPRQAAAHRLAAAEHAYAAGLTAESRRYATAALRDEADPATRVQARLLLLELAGQDQSGAGPLLDAAYADAAGAPDLLARVRLYRAIKANYDGDPESAVSELKRAEEAAESCGDTDRLIDVLTWTGVIQPAVSGHNADDFFDRAGVLARGRPLTREVVNARQMAAMAAAFRGDLETAVRRIEALRAEVERVGSVRDLASVLISVSSIYGRIGRWSDALLAGRQCLRLFEDIEPTLGPGLVAAAGSELGGGDVTMAGRLADRAIAACVTAGDDDWLMTALAIRGQAYVAAGDGAAAVAPMRRAYALQQRAGQMDPAVWIWHADFIEALAGVGELVEAHAVLAEVRGCAAHLGRTVALLGLDRAAAACMAGAGDVRGAADSLAAALEARPGHPSGFEIGRARYALGVLERRAHRRGAARQALTEAVERFTVAGARTWRAVAAAELARLDGGARPDGALSETERRIVEQVRLGATNREIAASLYLSVKAVEANLTRLYRRLNVRNRAQLVRALDGDGSGPDEIAATVS